MIRPRAIVYDLDGTLVDSRRDIADALNRTLSAHGREELPLERVLPMIGDGARALVARAFSFSPEDPAIEAPLASFGRFYAERPCVHTTLLPGARECLALPFPSAIVTNKPRSLTMLVLAALGVDVRVVRGGGDGPLKPDPALVLSALTELGVAPAEAWLVGDGPQDVLAGKAAGCTTVLVPGIAERERGLAAGPDLVLASLGEVVRILNAAEA